jgi:cyanophycinase
MIFKQKYRSKYQTGKKFLILTTTIVSIFLLLATVTYSQKKGTLFIIGGGERSTELMEELVKTASLSAADYIVVLPMATSIPVESVELISSELSRICPNRIASFNFTRAQADDKQVWIDSVRHARLIYITGGDQNKFMAVVKGTKLYDALHGAFENGATISGTSAGAAIMSRIMITGDEKDNSTEGTFRSIKTANVITSQGMGFLTNAIIDQHFIKRSRYNRILSVLADNPDKTVIGIDESTAIIVKGKKIRVTGENQVVVVSRPQKIKSSDKNKAGFRNAQLSLLMSDDEWNLK